MKKRTEEILNLLDEQYGREYICYLNYETPWQLLIATMLSAQCTDARVSEGILPSLLLPELSLPLSGLQAVPYLSPLHERGYKPLWLHPKPGNQ